MKRGETVQICQIYVQKEKKGDVQNMDRVQVLCGIGLHGDCHADGSNRQISILSQRAFLQKQNTTLYPCLQKVHANLIIDGIENVQVGQYIRFGDTVLRITKKGRPCHGICQASEEQNYCLFVNDLFFAVAQTDGMLSLGMKGEIL